MKQNEKVKGSGSWVYRIHLLYVVSFWEKKNWPFFFADEGCFVLQTLKSHVGCYEEVMEAISLSCKTSNILCFLLVHVW